MTAMTGATAFFTRTYDETRDLLQEARDYLAHVAHLDTDDLDPETRLRFSLESSRLTARLINLMAWLMLQRAVQAGEIEPSEAIAEAPDLNAHAAILGAVGCGDLPQRMGRLMDRSERLYVRVARLDEMARRRSA